ncbi:MAG: PKD domain-containing protein [Bacteroidetes bacterium]|nr:PKD domain-containing protein [Bacteroidota bacterium]
MKTTLRLFLISFLLLVTHHLLANTVIVKGILKNAANLPVANKKVKIYSIDSTNGGCALIHTTLSNPNGYYTDTLTCNGDIRKLLIQVENCDGTLLQRDPTVGTSNLVEINFVLCLNKPAPVCKAAFSYTSVATGIKFNGAGAAAAAGDSIISRTWTFGDSSAALTGNRVDPTHVYVKAGIYTACLTITTKLGCRSSYCQQVVFTPASNDCRAVAAITVEKLAPKKFRFNSSQSSTLPGDSIFQRIWKFGDNSSLDGNLVNPLKEFRDTGNYTVCLSIRTVKGCEKQICINLLVKGSISGTTVPPTNCKAQFGLAMEGKTVKFNSTNAYAGSGGDSIIGRTWVFGDGYAPLTGNRVDPSHSYNKAGRYTACLYIRTKNGCESKTCQEFDIKDSTIIPNTCKAYFTWAIKDSLVMFNSAGSKAAGDNDSIISRTWYYADNSTSVSLGGNVISPSYPYTLPGSYTVYLIIKTKAGCESKYASTIVIQPHQTTGCQAIVKYSVQNNVAYFTSGQSRGTSLTDSILSRTWFFGDGSAAMQGNRMDPSHTYPKPGKYLVALYIKTRSGCESKYSDTVTIGPVNCPVDLKFTAERISLKKVAFNSGQSKALPGDSIIQRVWKFGDNTVLSGNEITTVKEFPLLGAYTTCLQVKTLNGCEAKACKQIVIGDTLNTPQSSVDYIKILQINPNPVVTRMMATLYSRNSNVEAEITVFDIYGMAKLRLRRMLQQGNNQVEMGCESLYQGPYFLKVTTKTGKDSKLFYKL